MTVIHWLKEYLIIFHDENVKMLTGENWFVGIDEKSVRMMISCVAACNKGNLCCGGLRWTCIRVERLPDLWPPTLWPVVESGVKLRVSLRAQTEVNSSHSQVSCLRVKDSLHWTNADDFSWRLRERTEKMADDWSKHEEKRPAANLLLQRLSFRVYMRRKPLKPSVCQRQCRILRAAAIISSNNLSVVRKLTSN